MYENKTKQKLQNGQIASVVSGLLANSGDGIDFLGSLGFDGCWLEAEHGPVTWEQIGDLSRACDLWGMSSIIRVQSGDPALITRAFDRGASGIVIPHVNTADDARQIAQAAKFAPDGVRGIYGGRRSYRAKEYFAEANQETLVIVLIEEKRAVDNLAEILTVDNIDVFFVAPGDLAQTMGLPGQPFCPEVQAVVQGALAQIAAAGRTPGTLSNPQFLTRYKELGCRFFLTSSDAWVQAGAADYQAQLGANG